MEILLIRIEASRFGGETVVGLTRTVCLNESPPFFPACSFFGQNGLVGSERLRKYSRGAPEPSPTLRDPFPTHFRVAFPTHSRVAFEPLWSRFRAAFKPIWPFLVLAATSHDFLHFPVNFLAFLQFCFQIMILHWLDDCIHRLFRAHLAQFLLCQVCQRLGKYFLLDAKLLLLSI